MKILLRDSYLSIIKNSTGTRIFQSLYFRQKNKRINILNKGKLSCAFHVSSILNLFNLVSTFHTTVKGTIKDMIGSGWKEIKKPKIGAVLLWEKKNGNEHLGFCIGNQKAISNSSKRHVPIIHHWSYNNKRKIIAIYWNRKLK